VDGERVDAQAIFLEQAAKPKKTDVDAKPIVLKTNTKAVAAEEREEKIGQPA
jgi:hypothetical protein